MKTRALAAFALAALVQLPHAAAGPLDPDCTAEKAARSAATKATVGVGGRCDPKEAAADSTKRAVGVEDKGPVDKRRGNDGPAENAADAARKAKK